MQSLPILRLLIALLAVTASAAGLSRAEERTGPVMKADLAEWLKTTGAELTKKKREWAVEDLAHSLAAAKKGVVDSAFPEVQRSGSSESKYSDDRYWFKTAESKAKHVAKLEARLAEARKVLASNQPIPPDLRVDQMRVGAVGKLRCVRDAFEPEAISRTATVLQVIDGNNLICKMGETYFWLEGPTEGIVDDQAFDVGDLCYEVIGTTRYKTVIGTRTVFKVRRLTTE